MPNEPSFLPQPGVEQSPEPNTVDAATGAYEGTSLGDGSVQHQPLPDWPIIPGYEIIDVIAQGGMGRVFAGRDLRLDREVAIKTLLPGADAERFVTEAKITARLPHPGIPPVHELGTLADGAPYLVMKLIRGRTLADLLKERSSPNDGLSRWVQVFEQTAQAVGFAHAQGIIHRDLKPANVMVGAFGEVQVMDWGLAKDLEARSASEGAATTPTNTSGPVDATQAGTVLGTAAYMAPEQARGEVVDARADVFGLGAILTQMLTGRPPFVAKTSRETLEKAAAADLGDTLTRLSASAADAELIDLAKQCLAARVDDRLPDAQEVARQAAAYRAGVELRLRHAETQRAEALVREAEQRKRRRVLQWAAGAVAAVLLLGIVGTFGMVRAFNAAEAERDARTQADLAAESERQANETTKKRLTQIEKGAVLFAGLLKGLNPRAEEQGAPPLYEQLRERAAKAADELVGEAVGDPEAVARLQTLLGETLVELGDTGKAVEVLERARTTREGKLGADHPDTISTLGNLALAYHYAGKLPEAIALHEQVRDARMKKLGADHPSTLITLNNLAMAYKAAGKLPEAIALHEQVRDAQVKKLGADSPYTLTTLANLAGAYRATGKLPEAIALYEQVRDGQVKKLGAEHTSTLTTLANLAGAYRAAGKLPEAIALHEQVRDAQMKKLGADHPSTLITLNNLAMAYQAAGKLPEAIALHEQVRDAQMKKLGADHPSTLNTLNNLALAHQIGGKLPKAIALYERVRDARMKSLGADHPDTLNTLNNLAGAYQAAGKLPEAIALHEQVREARVKKLGADHPSTLTTLANLASAYEAAGKLPEAIALHEQVHEARVKKLGADHPSTLSTLNSLASAYHAAGKLPEAIALLEQVRKARVKKLGGEHPDTLITLNNLALAYKSVGKLPEGLALFEQVRNAQVKKLGADHPHTLTTLNNLARAYKDAGKLPEALDLFQQAAAGIEKRRFQHEHAGRIIPNTITAYEQAKQLDKAEAWRRKWLAVVKVRSGADSTAYAGELAG